jgi:hypothetical protein
VDRFLFLEILALALTGLLVYHSLRCRGAAFTAIFFTGGAFLGILRENAVALWTPLYTYNPATFHLWIGQAPLILGVFWSCTIYMGLSLSEVIAGGSLVGGRRRGAVVLLAMAFLAAYACFNEAYASMFPMVLWKFTPAAILWGGAPVMVLWGYAGMALIFLLFLVPIFRLRLPAAGRAAVFSASALLMIPLHLGWIWLFSRLMLLAAR